VTFNSIPFWSFCLAVVSLYYLMPHRFRWVWLLAASYVFYGSFDIRILAVLAGLTAFVYGASRAMEGASGRARRLLLLANIGAPLLALVVFKYLSLFWQAFCALGHVLVGTRQAEPFNILVPIGISFYVFKLVSYAIDVYRRKIPAEAHVGYFALYVSYFPQILAGPIERAGDFLPQAKRPVSWKLTSISEGVRLVAWGLFKKLVVADRLAFYVGEVFLSPNYKSGHLLFGAYFYYVQIYCDFSGYSDISTGLSRMLGLAPPVNFNYPYLARSVSDFWTRWHITLSSWLRDYLFLPITYVAMRKIATDRWWGVRAEVWGYAIGTLLTMALAGLWHGAAWTFVAWGVLHGIYLVVSRTTSRARRRLGRAIRLNHAPRLQRMVRVALTFNLVSLAWILFRATSFEHAWTYLRYLQFKLPPAGMANLVFDLAIVAVLFGLEYVQRNRARLPILDRVPIELKAVGYALFVIAALAFSVDASNPFIYFRF